MSAEFLGRAVINKGKIKKIAVNETTCQAASISVSKQRVECLTKNVFETLSEPLEHSLQFRRSTLLGQLRAIEP